MPNNIEFQTLMDEVCTALLEGLSWHGRSANQMRHLALRGIGRWHEAESKCDHVSKLCLEKLLQDKLSYEPQIDTSIMDSAVKYSVPSINDLKKHLTV